MTKQRWVHLKGTLARSPFPQNVLGVRQHLSHPAGLGEKIQNSSDQTDASEDSGVRPSSWRVAAIQAVGTEEKIKIRATKLVQTVILERNQYLTLAAQARLAEGAGAVPVSSQIDRRAA
jgi:hypothetical protein